MSTPVVYAGFEMLAIVGVLMLSYVRHCSVHRKQRQSMGATDLESSGAGEQYDSADERTLHEDIGPTLPSDVYAPTEAISVHTQQETIEPEALPPHQPRSPPPPYAANVAATPAP
ncbi:hypothetical protein LPJ59_005284 [Coemansia sp. RSA 2399]|nr:hypothetical protein LPJ59_005284 [Coemansia sp. RSA 2399]